MGFLTNFKIIGMKDPDGVSFDVPLVFEAMFNPDTYTVEHQNIYDLSQPVGSTAKDPNFSIQLPVRFSFEFTIDATGVASDIIVPVPKQMLLFNKVTIDVDGDSHRSNYLIVQWGSFIRDCILISARTTYTLFNSEGIPLRAKINASFLERKGTTLNQIANMFSSPDLTHSKIVSEGDILPLMVFREYKNQDYYLQVARTNGLKNFRELKQGTTLNFYPKSDHGTR